MTLSLAFSSCFQLWHAFGTKMYGRYMLLAVHVVLMGPWARCILPLKMARRLFWADLDRVSENDKPDIVIELRRSSDI